MSKRWIKAAATSQTIDIFVLDSSSTIGAGLTGLAFNTAGLTCYYRKGALGTPTSVTLATLALVTTAWATGGFIAVDATNMPGVYRLDIPNVVIDTAGMVTMYLRGATNMAPVVLELEVVAVDIYDTIRLGLTALPNTACTTNASLITSGTGTAQLSVASGLVTLAGVTHTGAVIPTVTTVSNRVSANTDQWNAVAVTGMPMPTYVQPSGFLAATFPATIASTTNITAGTIATVTNRVSANTDQWAGVAVTGMPMPTYVQPSGYLAATFPLTIASTTNITAGTIATVSGNVNGNVAGSVGSVIGAVGSVTGAVGSVTGAVGSVTGAVGSVTSAVTVGTINANVITATSINADAITAAKIATGAIDADALATDAVTEIADGILARDIGSGTNALTTLNERTVRSALRAVRNKSSIATSTLTVTTEDDTTTAWTAAVTSNAAADPVTGVDPV